VLDQSLNARCMLRITSESREVMFGLQLAIHGALPLLSQEHSSRGRQRYQRGFRAASSFSSYIATGPYWRADGQPLEFTDVLIGQRIEPQERLPPSPFSQM
jgi:hypothetical protein